MCVCHDGGTVLVLPQGDLYYVLVVPVGVCFTLTLELFIFPDSDDLDSLPVRQLGPGSSFLFWLGKVEFLIISESV